MSTAESETTCANCGYALQALEQTKYCPECGAPHALADPALYALERRIVGRHDRYRRDRDGCVFLGGASVLGIILLILIVGMRGATPGSPNAFFEPIMIMSMLWNGTFWFALAYAFHARLQHAKSVRIRDRARSDAATD